jgi:hypothetical protein
MKITKETYLLIPEEQRSGVIFKEYVKCKFDPKYTIQNYFSVKSKSKRIPFKLFPHQVEMIDAYEGYNQNISMKTRQMGFTTGTAVYLAWVMATKNNQIIKIVSKSMTDSQKFLKEIRDMLDDARKTTCINEKTGSSWLIPDFDKSNNNKRSFTLTTGSIVIAEATTEDAGRGDTLNYLIVDEAAAIDRRNPEKMAEIWSAAGVALTNARGKAIIISTPKGMSGWYYDQYTNAKEIGWNVIDAHWIRHPEYSLGTYQWISQEDHPDGGYIKWYNDDWPKEVKDPKTNTYKELDKATYPFVLDGKIRSPWYDNESKALGPRRTKCELDCSFAGTGGEVIDADLIRELKTYADSCKYTNEFESLGGIYRKYKEYIPYNETHKYVISADVATGDGLDWSTFIVLDLTTLEICATYKEQLLPETFALILSAIGKRYGSCQLIVENQGGGSTTLQELKRQGYANLYYSTLNKKDPSTGLRRRKIGLWASEDVRWQGGDKLEGAIRLNQIKIPCSDIIEELYTWIWDKDGKRRHAPEKNDDLLMALQHGIWYRYFVYTRGERNKNNFKAIFEVQRGNKRLQFSDSPHGRGTIIPKHEAYAPNDMGKKVISGNLDNMIDRRILTRKELEEIDKKTQSGRRLFI